MLLLLLLLAGAEDTPRVSMTLLKDGKRKNILKGARQRFGIWCRQQNSQASVLLLFQSAHSPNAESVVDSR